MNDCGRGGACESPKGFSDSRSAAGLQISANVQSAGWKVTQGEGGRAIIQLPKT